MQQMESKPLRYTSSGDLRVGLVVPTIRPATEADLPALDKLATSATHDLLGPFLSAEQRASCLVFTPFDPWLITDGSYFVAELDGVVRASGGWSRRMAMVHQPTDQTTCPDPSGPARIRAMYTDPDYARLGLGRTLLAVCEVSARLSGHFELELLATPIGRLLYLSSGFETLESVEIQSEDNVFFEVFRMQKSFSAAMAT
nr:GNAT family N-acetyltransferase [Ruegeria sp. A3M17]